MPGGLLVVEAVLVPGLVSSGMALPSAISAMLIYRLVSWIFISAIGWGCSSSCSAPRGAGPEAVVDELAAAEAADLQTRRAPRDPADTALQGPVPRMNPAATTLSTPGWINDHDDHALDTGGHSNRRAGIRHGCDLHPAIRAVRPAQSCRGVTVAGVAQTAWPFLALTGGRPPWWRPHLAPDGDRSDGSRHLAEHHRDRDGFETLTSAGIAVSFVQVATTVTGVLLLAGESLPDWPAGRASWRIAASSPPPQRFFRSVSGWRIPVRSVLTL